MSLRALPTIAIPVILYNALVVFAGEGSAASFLHVPLFTMRMIRSPRVNTHSAPLIIFSVNSGT